MKPVELDPAVADLIKRVDALGRPQLDTLDPWQLQALLQQGLIAGALPRRTDLARVETFTIPRADGGLLSLRLYEPRTFVVDRIRPVMLFFHGGGYMLGNLETHDALAADLAVELDVTVVAVDYRLAPQHVFPAAVEDVRTAMAWVSGSPEEIGHQVSGLILGGDSAGGSLSAVGAQFSGEWGVPVLVQWLMYAGTQADATGGSMDRFSENHLLTGSMMRTFRDAYFAGANRRHPHASPIFYEHPERLPPAMVFTCGFDPLRDQGRAYAARLITHGVAVRYREAQTLVHGAFAHRHFAVAAQEHFTGCLADVRSIISEQFQHPRGSGHIDDNARF